MRVKFYDSIHNWSEDSFQVEHNSRGTYVRVYQEMQSGNVAEVYLSMKDVEQMYDEMRRVFV